MPLPSDDPDQAQIEVKIESFLRDTSKIYIETQFTWATPKPPGTAIDPQDLLEQVDAYVEREVTSFVTRGHQ